MATLRVTVSMLVLGTVVLTVIIPASSTSNLWIIISVKIMKTKSRNRSIRSTDSKRNGTDNSRDFNNKTIVLKTSQTGP